MTSRHELSQWIRGTVAELLNITTDDVDPHAAFTDLGMSSLQAAQLAGDLENYLGRVVPVTAVYDFPSVEKLVTEYAVR